MGAQIRITFRRIPFQQVQTELRKGCFLVGKQIETWTKKAAFSTVLNAVSSFKHVSARAGTVIHTRIKAALVSESAPPVLGIDVEKPNSSERLERRPLQAQQRLPTAAQERVPPMQLRRESSMRSAPLCVDGIPPENPAFNEDSMQCLVCPHLIECFYKENRSGPSESKRHIATRCRFPKKTHGIEVIA